MAEAGMATMFTLLHNYEEYGDEVMIHNGRIVCIVAGKKKAQPRLAGRAVPVQKYNHASIRYSIKHGERKVNGKVQDMRLQVRRVGHGQWGVR